MSNDRNPRFSEDERRALSSVLDEIIPPSNDGRFPGAGELGLGNVKCLINLCLSKEFRS